MLLKHRQESVGVVGNGAFGQPNSLQVLSGPAIISWHSHLVKCRFLWGFSSGHVHLDFLGNFLCLVVNPKRNQCVGRAPVNQIKRNGIDRLPVGRFDDGFANIIVGEKTSRERIADAHEAVEPRFVPLLLAFFNIYSPDFLPQRRNRFPGQFLVFLDFESGPYFKNMEFRNRLSKPAHASGFATSIAQIEILRLSSDDRVPRRRSSSATALFGGVPSPGVGRQRSVFPNQNTR